MLPETAENHTKQVYNQASGANRVARNQAQKDVANYRWGRQRNLLTLKGLGHRSPAYRSFAKSRRILAALRT